jgi:hypothetical protein
MRSCHENVERVGNTKRTSWGRQILRVTRKGESSKVLLKHRHEVWECSRALTIEWHYWEGASVGRGAGARMSHEQARQGFGLCLSVDIRGHQDFVLLL